MSANTYLLDAMTRRQIMLQRFSAGQVADLDDIFTALANDLAAVISRETSSPLQVLRAQRLMVYANEAIGNTVTTMRSQVVGQLELLAQDEVDFTLEALRPTINLELDLPPANLVIAAVSDAQTTIVTGDIVRRLGVEDMFREFDEKKSREIGGIIRSGIISGRTTDELARDVSRTVTTRTKRQAATIVRTSVNAVATSARQATLTQNADVLTGVKWVSTLDGRTSMLCMGRDQKIYPVDSGPRPPAHWACRSTVVPEVDHRFTVPGFEGARQSKDGPVDARTTYNSWLKRQSKGFQDEVLGDTKAKLFRSGGLHLDKFTDDVGITYNIDQLRQLHPLAFERAGID